MKIHALTIFAFALTTLGSWNVNSAAAQGQNVILAETYGQGVHAFNGGRLTDATGFFTLAIDNGSRDPRAYYYRGIVNYVSDRLEEAEKDWSAGAAIEAMGGPNLSIGRSLARFQGNGRLKLEQIRQTARLIALAEANARSKQRYGEIKSTPENSTVFKPAPRIPAQPIAPPPTPPAASNPFTDSNLGKVTPIAEDALAGAMSDPFANEPKAAAPTAGGGAANPFGGGGAAAGGGAADPFGGGGAAAGGGAADPFGGSDPFGS